MPLFQKSQLSVILNSSDESHADSGFLEKIKNRMADEMIRCVIHCPEQHLARLACGTQPMGIAFDANLLDFKIIFTHDDEHGLPDPWHPKALDEIGLPSFPPLGETGTASGAVDVAAE